MAVRDTPVDEVGKLQRYSAVAGESVDLEGNREK